LFHAVSLPATRLRSVARWARGLRSGVLP
jgi:hypothetical protein